MTQLIKTDASPTVMDFLYSKGLIAYNLLGAIEHTEELLLYVDDLDKPTGVVGVEGYFMYVVTDETSFVDDLMQTFCKNDDYYGFTGIDQRLADYILTKEVKLHWRNDCYVYYLPEGVILPENDPRVSCLTSKDAEEVNEYYEYKGDYSLGQIQTDIKDRPSSCIRVDGELASWVIIHRDDTMGIMFTKEKYRKQHFAHLVTIDLMRKVRAIGKLPYVQILTSNHPSQRLAEKAQLVKAKEMVTWFGIVVGNLPIDDEE